MATNGVLQGRGPAIAEPARGGVTTREALLACGILSSLLYAAMLVAVPM